MRKVKRSAQINVSIQVNHYFQTYFFTAMTAQCTYDIFIEYAAYFYYLMLVTCNDGCIYSLRPISGGSCRLECVYCQDKGQ